MSPTPVAELSIIERRTATPNTQWLTHLRETYEIVCRRLDQGAMEAELRAEHRQGTIGNLLDRGEWDALLAGAAATPRRPALARTTPAAPPRRARTDKNEHNPTGTDRG